MIKLTDLLAEATFESEKHIAIYSGPDGVANVYKLDDGSYYARVEGNPDYNIVAKTALEMAGMLKKDGLINLVAGELS